MQSLTVLGLYHVSMFRITSHVKFGGKLFNVEVSCNKELILFFPLQHYNFLLTAVFTCIYCDMITNAAVMTHTLALLFMRKN